ncbi:MAG: L-rhamnose mutarotase [Chitinophagales bacterium]|nr:L-rhamnose mutarotase [Chitinophagales bacterium]
MIKKYCLVLDLKDDPRLIAEYEEWHRNVWPEVMASIRDSGIKKMEIFRAGNRLCMVIEAGEEFSFETKRRMDLENEKVQQWEALMDNFQQRLPFAGAGQKWVLMDKIFEL